MLELSVCSCTVMNRLSCTNFAFDFNLRRYPEGEARAAFQRSLAHHQHNGW
jgi:hypothetical protein